MVEGGRNEERYQCGSVPSQIGAVLARIPRTSAADPYSSESRQILDLARGALERGAPALLDPGRRASMEFSRITSCAPRARCVSMPPMPKDPPPENPENNPLDPAAAKKAYAAMTPRMNALAKDQLSLLNVDAQESAIIALSVSRLLAEPEASARFALLHAKTFDPAHLGDLATIALTVSHVYVELRTTRPRSRRTLSTTAPPMPRRRARALRRS